MMNCIIIDDEFPARVLLEGYISEIPYLKLLKIFNNPVAARPYLNENPVELMFIDIEMPHLTGTEFLRTLAEKPMAILTTAYPDYALEGYELDVVDYLVKPISFERFLKAADKAHRQHQQGLSAFREVENFILLKADHKTYKIFHDDISYIEGAREYVIFHTTSGKIMILEALKKLEEILPEQFIRIHKSFIVNKNKIKVQHGSKSVQLGTKVFPIGKSYRNKVVNIFAS